MAKEVIKVTAEFIIDVGTEDQAFKKDGEIKQALLYKLQGLSQKGLLADSYIDSIEFKECQISEG